MPTRVLLIDDEPESVKQETLQPLVAQPQNYEIIVETGESILTIVDKLDHIDIILLDYRFDFEGQNITGLSILREIRAARGGKDVPVVVLSRVDDLGGPEVWGELTRSLQVADFLSKSTPPEVIQYKIDREIKAARDRKWLEQIRKPPQSVTRLSDRAIRVFRDEIVGSNAIWEYCERLAFEEGPEHARFANTALLGVLGEAIAALEERLQSSARPYSGGMSDVFVHVPAPPHERDLAPGGRYPLGVPTRLLEESFDPTQVSQVVAAVGEGPPHQVMFRLLVLHALEALFDLSQRT